MDGYELAEWISDNAPGTKVILMTGCQRSEADEHMHTGIVDGWVFKPITTRELSGMVSGFVETV